MSFKEINPWFKEVFMLVDDACKALHVTLYLIGAQARHFHLAQHGIRPGRGTMDIDFAIMLPDMGVYDLLFDKLISFGFRKVTEPYRIIYDKTNTVVDLLPFGQVEEKGTITFTDRKTELSVIGLKEILEKPDIISLDEETEVQVTPLAGLIILKLISYYEKPERTRDLDDIHDILVNYFDVNQDRFYQNHDEKLDEFISDNFILEAGAWLAGYDIGIVLNKNPQLKELILRILQREIDLATGGISSYLYGKDLFDDVDSIKRIVSVIIKGINQQS